MRTTAHRQSRIVMALESEEGTGVDNLDVDVVNGDGAESALLELQETGTAADNAEVSADDLENSAISLESLVEVATKSLDADGLDETSAELLQTAVENELAPLSGAVPVDEIIPAMESFGSPSSRRDATIMVIEAIGEQAKKLWAKVREMIQKIRDFFKSLWIKAKTAVQGLQRRVKALQADAATRNFSMPKAGGVELKDGRWAVTGAQVSDLAKLVDEVLGTYNASAVSYANSVATNVNAGKAPEGSGKSKVKAPALDSLSGKALPGGRKFVGGDNGYVLQGTDGEGKAYSAKPLAEAEVKSILEGLDAIAASVVNYEKGFQAKDRAEEAVLKAGDAFSKKAKDGDEGAKTDARAVFNSTRDAAQLLNNPTRDVIRYAASAISGIGAFVAANLKQYDKK